MSAATSAEQIIALDAMGGDRGPDVVIPGAALAAKQLDGVRYLMFGREDAILPLLNAHPELKKISDVVHTDHVVSSHEKPSVALRSGKDSSMRLAINAVSEGRAQSIVSAGNTGALMAMSKLVLRSLPGIDRPAIASVFPTMSGLTTVLDLGANIVCSPENLVEFAILGAIYARVMRNIENPTIGLLNVGTEEMKGHENVRAAAAILKDLKFPGRFHGYVEGNDIPLGTVDVVVTDGFTGNVALKLAEGMGKLTGTLAREAFSDGPLARMGALFAYPALKRLSRRMDPRFYNGGMFLGLDGVCIKSHGGMDSTGFCNAVTVAANLVAKGYNKRVAEEIGHLKLPERAANGKVQTVLS